MKTTNEGLEEAARKVRIVVTDVDGVHTTDHVTIFGKPEPGKPSLFGLHVAGTVVRRSHRSRMPNATARSRASRPATPTASPRSCITWPVPTTARSKATVSTRATASPSRSAAGPGCLSS